VDPRLIWTAGIVLGVALGASVILLRDWFGCRARRRKWLVMETAAFVARNRARRLLYEIQRDADAAREARREAESLLLLASIEYEGTRG
jgi:hypothetical protein